MPTDVLSVVGNGYRLLVAEGYQFDSLGSDNQDQFTWKIPLPTGDWNLIEVNYDLSEPDDEVLFVMVENVPSKLVSCTREKMEIMLEHAVGDEAALQLSFHLCDSVILKSIWLVPRTV